MKVFVHKIVTARFKVTDKLLQASRLKNHPVLVKNRAEEHRTLGNHLIENLTMLCDDHVSEQTPVVSPPIGDTLFASLPRHELANEPLDLFPESMSQDKPLGTKARSKYPVERAAVLRAKEHAFGVLLR